MSARALLAIVTVATLAALAPPAHSAGAARLTLGPYVQDVREDGFTVAFETDVPVTATVVVGAQQVTTSGTRHEARVSGLQPGTRHPYQLLLGGATAAEGEVSTFARSGPLRFVVFGDTRDESIGRALAASIAADHPDLLLGTGDLVHRGDDEAAWRAFFAGEAPLLRSVPLYPVAGNHELWRDPEGAHFRRYFVLPGGRERRYYSFRVGAVRFIALDGNRVTPDPSDPQTLWLKETLDRSVREGDRHVFVWLHQPPFSTGVHCGAAPAEQRWVELFERYRVRAVFAGHDHAYERLERNGVHYFVSGGGGAPLYQERSGCPAYDRAALRRYLPVHHYLRVQVNGDEVQVDALAPGGGAPIESTRFSAHDPIAQGSAPPLVDDRPITSRYAYSALHQLKRRWPIALLVLASLLLLGRVVQKRRLG